MAEERPVAMDGSIKGAKGKKRCQSSIRKKPAAEKDTETHLYR